MAENPTTTGDQFLGCFIAFGILAVALYACSPDPTPEQIARNAEIEKIVEGRMRVERMLKDPDSADFTNERIAPSGSYCASVNARNSFGGYNGPMRVMSLGEQVVTEESTDSASFERAWSISC